MESRRAPRGDAARRAIAKARTAAIFRRPSREFEEQVKNGRVAALARS